MAEEKLIKIKWIDSTYLGGWHNLNELNMKSELCTTIGYLEEDKKDCIIISQSKQSGGYCQNLIAIPKCAIKSKKRFKI
jgi:hypothetical protein